MVKHTWDGLVLCLIGLVFFLHTLNAYAADYQTLDWRDLIPDDDYSALQQPAEWVLGIDDGAENDRLETLQTFLAEATDDPYQQALTSTQFKSEYDNQSVRIPGFIVPLAFNDEQKVTEFFIVPYFVACIHVPPPPPNQIIFGQSKRGFEVGALYKPRWIAGLMRTEVMENEVATAAYQLKVDSVEITKCSVRNRTLGMYGSEQLRSNGNKKSLLFNGLVAGTGIALRSVSKVTTKLDTGKSQ